MGASDGGGVVESKIDERVQEEHKQSIKVMYLLSFILMAVLGLLFFLAVNFDWAWNKFIRADSVSSEKIAEDGVALQKAKIAIEANRVVAIKYGRVRADVEAVKTSSKLIALLEQFKNDRYTIKNLEGGNYQPQTVAVTLNGRKASVAVPTFDASVLTLNVTYQSVTREFEFPSGTTFLTTTNANSTEADATVANAMLTFIHEAAAQNVNAAERNTTDLEKYIEKKKFEIATSGESKTLSYTDLISLVVNRLMAMALLLGVGAVCLRLIAKQYAHYTKVSALGLACRIAHDQPDNAELERTMKVAAFFEDKGTHAGDDMIAVATAASKVLEAVKPKR